MSTYALGSSMGCTKKQFGFSTDTAILKKSTIARSIIVNERYVDFVGSIVVAVQPTTSCGYAIAVVKVSNNESFIGSNGRICRLLYLVTGELISFKHCLNALLIVLGKLQKVHKIVVNTEYISDADKQITALFKQWEYKPIVRGLNLQDKPTIQA